MESRPGAGSRVAAAPPLHRVRTDDIVAEWVWEGQARSGEMRNGVMEADSADTVTSRLRAMQLQKLKVKKKPKELKLSLGTGVATKDLVVFTRQFATMIASGLPLVQCLDILSSQGDNASFKRILQDIKGRVETGATFSDALKSHPKVFDSLFINLVAAGETGGILDTILGRLAIYIEKRVKLGRQVRGAMVYPVAVAGIALAVLIVMMTMVIPSFKEMFADFGAENALPALTQIVIDISDWFMANIFLVFGSIGGGITGLIISWRKPRSRRIWDFILLKAPVIGPVFTKIAVARFTRTLGTLLSSGVPIIEALLIVKRSAGNVIVEDAIEKTSNQVKEGHSLSGPLANSKVFPSMVVQMIAVGEETGALDSMLNKIADFYEEEVDVAVGGLTSLLEPVMMVGIGGMVGVLLIAMYLPIFDIASHVTPD